MLPVNICKHLGDGLCVVLGVEEAGAGDKNVGAGLGESGDVFGFYAAVDFDGDIQIF